MTSNQTLNKINDAKRVALADSKKEAHEDNGYWYTWVETPAAGGKRGWNSIPISERDQKKGFWDFVDYTEEFGYEACDD